MTSVQTGVLSNLERPQETKSFVVTMEFTDPDAQNEDATPSNRTITDVS